MPLNAAQTFFYPGDLQSGRIGKFDPNNALGIANHPNPYNISNDLYGGDWVIPVSGTQVNPANTSPTNYVNGHGISSGGNFLQLKNEFDTSNGGSPPFSMYFATKGGGLFKVNDPPSGTSKSGKFNYQDNGGGNFTVFPANQITVNGQLYWSGGINTGLSTTQSTGVGNGGSGNPYDPDVCNMRAALMQATWKNVPYPQTGEPTGSVVSIETNNTIPYGPGFPIWNIFRAAAVTLRNAWGNRPGRPIVSIFPEGNGGWFDHGLGHCNPPTNADPVPANSMDFICQQLNAGLLGTDIVPPDPANSPVNYIPNLIKTRYGTVPISSNNPFTYGYSLDYIKAFRAISKCYKEEYPDCLITWNNALGAQFGGGAPTYTGFLYPGDDVVDIISNNYYPTLGHPGTPAGSTPQNPLGDDTGFATILGNVACYWGLAFCRGKAWGSGETGPRLIKGNTGSVVDEMREATNWVKAQAGFLQAIVDAVPNQSATQVNLAPGAVAFHSWFMPAKGTRTLAYAGVDPEWVFNSGFDDGTKLNGNNVAFTEGDRDISLAYRTQWIKSFVPDANGNFDQTEQTTYDLFVPHDNVIVQPPGQTFNLC